MRESKDKSKREHVGREVVSGKVWAFSDAVGAGRGNARAYGDACHMAARQWINGGAGDTLCVVVRERDAWQEEGKRGVAWVVRWGHPGVASFLSKVSRVEGRLAVVAVRGMDKSVRALRGATVKGRQVNVPVPV